MDQYLECILEASLEYENIDQIGKQTVIFIMIW